MNLKTPESFFILLPALPFLLLTVAAAMTGNIVFLYLAIVGTGLYIGGVTTLALSIPRASIGKIACVTLACWSLAIIVWWIIVIVTIAASLWR